MVDDAVAASALPEDGNVVAVAAERADVGLGPGDRRPLILDAEVAGTAAFGAGRDL